MTLKDNFDKNVRYNENGIESEVCVLIAEDFAIGFAEWKDENYFNQGDGFYNTNYKDEALYLKELLEIYKKKKDYDTKRKIERQHYYKY